MRVVIDTNVFISAALKTESVPGQVITEAARRHVLLKSVDVEKEVLETIERPRLAQLIAPTAQSSLRRVLANAESAQITERIAVCRDPKDDKFLELAVNGRADIIVSGDADLLSLHPFRGVAIETPAAFLRRVGG